jgi:uncharacterized damage-inducible protein DinB
VAWSAGLTEDARVTAPEHTPDRWTGATEHPDMWADPDDDPRESTAEIAGERAILLDYLRRYRLTVQLKCADLDAEQLARRSVPPSTMSLLGLVRHLAKVEHRWFRIEMDRQDLPRLYSTPDDRDADWNGAVADPAVVAEAWQAWKDEVAFAERWVAAHPDLSTRGGSGAELRDILVHMIEEYARHCGHADLLRERIDGRVGQ